MKRFYFFLGWIFFLTGAVLAQDKIVKLKIIETSDIHGNYYPYDFILRHEAGGSLARVYEIFCKVSLVLTIIIILIPFLRIWLPKY